MHQHSISWNYHAGSKCASHLVSFCFGSHDTEKCMFWPYPSWQWMYVKCCRTIELVMVIWSPVPLYDGRITLDPYVHRFGFINHSLGHAATLRCKIVKRQLMAFHQFLLFWCHFFAETPSRACSWWNKSYQVATVWLWPGRYAPPAISCRWWRKSIISWNTCISLRFSMDTCYMMS